GAGTWLDKSGGDAPRAGADQRCAAPAMLRFNSISSETLSSNWPGLMAKSLRLILKLARITSRSPSLPVRAFNLSLRNVIFTGTVMALVTPCRLILPPTSAVVTLPSVLTFFALSRSEEHTSELQSPDHLVCR